MVLEKNVSKFQCISAVKSINRIQNKFVYIIYVCGTVYIYM